MKVHCLLRLGGRLHFAVLLVAAVDEVLQLGSQYFCLRGAFAEKLVEAVLPIKEVCDGL